MITNASPLIIFGKINKLDLLKKVTKKLVISNEVYEEVVTRGIKINSSDALLIKAYIEKGEIEIKMLNSEWKEKAKFFQTIYATLDAGEAETIALALQEKEKVVLIDERTARKTSELLGLKPLGSLWVLIVAFKKNIITENEINQIIGKMISMGFRIGGDIINEFWDIFEKLKKKK